MKTTAMLLLAAALALAPSGPAAADDWNLETGREAALVGGAAAVWGTGLWARAAAPADTSTARLAAADLWAIDRVATRRWSPGADRAADRLVWVVALAPVGLMAAGPGRDEAGHLAVMYGETLLLSGGTTFALKNLVRRPRPFLYNDDPRIDDDLRRSGTAHRSFPSGHTAQAFAGAVFFAGTYARLHPGASSRGWVWAGCLGAAATTGWLRVEAGRHFPTDVLAGAVLGAACGWLVPALHETSGGGGGTPARFAVGFAF
ncbi:MAG TPA: phosphatase PAP2 family protein [Candidatus Krumholzibacteria bacterium]|nr:phosphatase PAP2 family protein [Candidatus Krumholzibacteria bacterium]